MSTLHISYLNLIMINRHVINSRTLQCQCFHCRFENVEDEKEIAIEVTKYGKDGKYGTKITNVAVVEALE